MGVVQRFQGRAAFDGPILGHSTFLSLTLNWAGGAVAGSGTYLFTGGAAYDFAISSLDASIGSAGGTLTASVIINGTSVDGLDALFVSAAQKTRYLALGSANTVYAGDIVAVLISAAGSPTDTYLVLNAVKI